MDWMEDIRKKSARKNRLMFSRDSAFLEDLSLCIAQQSHRTLVLWALDLAKETVDRAARNPHLPRACQGTFHRRGYRPVPRGRSSLQRRTHPETRPGVSHL